jgi:hypothetical protein
MNIQRVSSLLHVRVVVAVVVAYQVAVNLDSLGAVALLSVQLATFATVTNIDRLNEKGTLIFVMIMGLVMVTMVSSISLLANQSRPGRIKTEVSLCHQLLVERRIDSSILVEILR